MKGLLIGCVVFVFAINASFAQVTGMGQTIKPEMKPVEGGKVAWEKLEHDFKDVPQNVPANVTFSFVNETGAPILITDVKTSCGCTTPDWTKEPIAPGEKGEIKASYNAKKIGIFNKSVTVYTNNSTTPTRLKLTGNVVSSGTN